MRLIHRDPTTGLLKLRLETSSDIWRLARLVRPGDLTGASTTRRDPEAPEGAPAAQRERRRVWLVVRAEQVEFHEFSRHVRITGPIVEGPFDIGRHHTLDLTDGEEVSVLKPELTSGDRALLDEGLAVRTEPRLVLAAVDWGESTIVRLRGRSIDPVADVNRTLAGKRYAIGQAQKDREGYVEQLVELLLKELPEAQALVIAGPGFLKEELAKRLIERLPSARSKTKVVPTAESGRSGVQELLRSGRAGEILAGSVAAEEADLVEQLTRAVGGGQRAAIGPVEVGEAVDGGAVETLLVSESLLVDPTATGILDRARGGRGRVFIVRDDSEAGKRLTGLGKIAAILRYDWRPTSGARR